jgi:hypothetical protein
LHESSISLFQTLGDKGEMAATVNFVQGELRLLGRSRWWFGGVSSKSEIIRDRCCDGCMH